MSSAQQIDFSETRRLATEMIATGERILSLLEIQKPLPGVRAGTDSVVKLAVIRGIVAAKFGFTSRQILLQNRSAHVAWARMVGLFLCREMSNCSDLQIEEAFERTHGCLDNAVKTVRERCATQDGDGRRCAADVAELREQIIEALK